MSMLCVVRGVCGGGRAVTWHPPAKLSGVSLSVDCIENVAGRQHRIDCLLFVVVRRGGIEHRCIINLLDLSISATRLRYAHSREYRTIEEEEQERST